VHNNILIGKPEGKRTLERRRCRWKDTINKGCQRYRMRSCGLDSAGLGYILVAGCCEHGNEPSGGVTGGEIFD